MPRTPYQTSIVLIGISILALCPLARVPAATRVPVVETPAEISARLHWFEDARFGMFIHFGVYSTAAGSWNDQAIPSDSSWIQCIRRISAEEYRNALVSQFNPVKYDPEAWVLAAKEAGMKYIVITAKHHDGFCLWDSQATTWDVASTPYHKDLLKPLAEACRKHGLKFGLFYSIMDWSNPDYSAKAPWRGNARNAKPDMDRYVAFMKTQLRELLETNDNTAMLWFDGEWEDAWTHERGVEINNYLRAMKPDLIINNRLDKRRLSSPPLHPEWRDLSDFETPEQRIPDTKPDGTKLWETCMTMNDTWGYKSNDQNWKPAQTLGRNLIETASKGGNYLLNVGPTGEGVIPTASLDRLAAIGIWMRTNGESIHGTTASLFPKVSWDGRSTTRRNGGETQLYLHLFNQPKDGRLIVKHLMDRPQQARILGQSGELSVSGKPGEWILQLPDLPIGPIAMVVALTVHGDPRIEVAPIMPDQRGVLTMTAADATLHGTEIKLIENEIRFWINPEESLSWQLKIPAGKYRVTVDGACETAGSEMKFNLGAMEMPFSVPHTGNWYRYRMIEAGVLSLPADFHGNGTLIPVSGTGIGFLNLRSITLTKLP